MFLIIRFTVKAVKKCPIAAVYISILNLPRELVFQPRWTILAMTIPGPGEPSKLALNRVLEPLVADLKRLEMGLDFFSVVDNTQSTVYAQLLYVAADIPATRKASGSFSHNAKQPCNHCAISEDDLKSEDAFDWKCKFRQAIYLRQLLTYSTTPRPCEGQARCGCTAP